MRFKVEKAQTRIEEIDVGAVRIDFVRGYYASRAESFGILDAARFAQVTFSSSRNAVSNPVRIWHPVFPTHEIPRRKRLSDGRSDPIFIFN
jgi:hypothetical protein